MLTQEEIELLITAQEIIKRERGSGSEKIDELLGCRKRKLPYDFL